jgi:hypothetical protein
VSRPVNRLRMLNDFWLAAWSSFQLGLGTGTTVFLNSASLPSPAVGVGCLAAERRMGVRLLPVAILPRHESKDRCLIAMYCGQRPNSSQ